MSRQRFSGDAESLYDVLNSFVAKGGKSWLKYSDETENVSRSKLDKLSILSHKHLIGACHNIFPKLSFNRSLVHGIFEKIVREYASTWCFDKSNQEDWARTMTSRLRNMLHNVKRNDVKKNIPLGSTT